MKISKKEEDFRIYVEDDNSNYISSSNVLYSESFVDKRIVFKVSLSKEKTSPIVFNLQATREEIKSLTAMLNEVVKYL